MRPIVLRDEDPPDDDVVVVRAGEMKRDVVLRSALRSLREAGYLGVSVFAALDQTVPELCAQDPDLVRYGQIRTSTFRRLRQAGFAVLPTMDRPHFDILLPDVEVPTFERLEGCFDEAVQNPGRPR